LELEGQSTEGSSAVEKVRTALIDRDEVLQRAREDLVGVRIVAAEWEAEVASVRAQLQRDCTALEGARSWQSQAEERANEAEELKASLADKAATVVAAEERLRQERAARQEAESQLQQERATLVEAQAALERERLAREEALGQLQQERAALEGAGASLKEREDEVSKLDGELVALSISHEDQHQSLEEQGATVVSLQQAVEGGCQALEAEKKQVEGESLLVSYFVDLPFGDSLQLYFSCSWLPGLRTALGHVTTQAEAVRASYNSSQQELEELRAAALETCQAVEEGDAQAGSSLESRLRALGGHVSQRMHRALHLGVEKALGVVVSHYQVDFEAVASSYVVPVGVEDEVAMERADTLAAAATETLAGDFTDFLFPDAPDTGEPQA
jgi:hypothetical protein